MSSARFLSSSLRKSGQPIFSRPISTIVLTIRPTSPLLELANYHVLGRVLVYVPYMAPISPGRVLSTFGLLMAVIETINALGVAFASNPTGGNQGAGSAMILAALGMQLVVILAFVLLAGIFHRRIAHAKLEKKSVRIVLLTLYCSMALILVRSIYRLVEHVGNTEIDLGDPEALEALSPIMLYEWYFYVFEATMMFLNSVLWNVFNPGRFLPRDPHTYLARDGVTELLDDHKDDRSLIAKFGAVVSFGCFFRRREDRHFEQLHDHELSKRGAYGGFRSSRHEPLHSRQPTAFE
jgi:hypothetical protein